MRLVLKNVQVNTRMSEETTNFAATLYLDGIRIGTVGNDGRGGGNRYTFVSAEAREAFYDYVAEWAKDRGEMYEPEDVLVATALERWEIEKQARANQKKGFPVTIVCRRGKDELGWRETFIVGVKDKAHIEGYVKRERIDEYEVVELEPATQKRSRGR